MIANKETNTMNDYPFISVIMPIRNEAAFIERAIQSILQNDYPHDKIEILVADGMSDDDTRNIVQKLAQKDNRIILIDNPKKIVPTAMNLAIKQAKGDLFIRLDGHAEVYPDFIKSSVECLKQHPDAWVVGGPTETISHGYRGKAIAAALTSPIGAGNAKYRLANYQGWVDTLLYGIHHKWIVDKIGLFDEQLVRNQDDDFTFRIHLAGGKIWLSKSIRSKYFARQNFSNLWRQYFQYGFWRIRTLQKHKKVSSFRQMVPLLLVASILTLAALGFLHPFFWTLLLAESAAYTIALIAGARDVAKKTDFKHALLAPVIFLILHFAYGLGSAWGIFRIIILRGLGLQKPELTKLSR